MAKSVKAGEYSGSQINGFVKRIMAEYAALDMLTGEHMNRCQKRRKAIRGIILEAKEAGIDRNIMRLNIDVELAAKKLNKSMKAMEKEEAIEARLVAEARDDQRQMTLFGWTKDNKPTKTQIKALREKVEKKDKAKEPETASGKPPVGVSGTDLAAATASGTA